MNSRVRTPGEFCWFNILTPDADNARTFFAEMFKWEYGDIPGLGHTALVNNTEVGAIFDLKACPPSITDPTPVVGIMIKVKDVIETSQRIKELGGKAEDPIPIPHGKMAVCHDPHGNQFDLWQVTDEKQGLEANGAIHGVPSWIELVTSSRDSLEDFYAKLFGWSTERIDQPDYTIFSLDSRRVAGLCVLENMPQRWSTYYTVENVDEATKLAGTLGATVAFGPHDIPNVGRFSAIISPQGVAFHIITYNAEYI